MSRGRRLLRGAAAVLLVGALAPVLTGVPAEAAPQCAEPGKVVRAASWPQLRLSLEQAWRISTGQGVLVAVIGSGVDARQPQLLGRVLPGRDFRVAAPRRADADCTGMGTQVAGAVAARPIDGVRFTGVAPAALILPVGAAGSEKVDDDRGDPPGSTAALATAIRTSASYAGVIVVPVVTYRDDPALRAAVAYAVAKDRVVIAAIGEAPRQGPTTPYPAAYPDVIGVGAVDDHGALTTRSAASRYVDLVGPGGGEMLSTQRGGGLTPAEGSGIAAGYVAGAAALVRSRWPQLPAKEVAERLAATASPTAGGPGTPGYGQGFINPLQAVSASLVVSASPSPPPPYTVSTPDAKTVAAQAARSDSERRALLLAGAGALAALLLIMVAVALPRGRRRRWRAGMAPPPAEHAEDDMPAPPVTLFEDRR